MAHPSLIGASTGGEHGPGGGGRSFEVSGAVASEEHNPDAALGPADNEADRRLVLAAQQGSDGAFAVLYRTYRPVALRSARRHLAVRNRSLAEDVVEVTFASIYDALRRGHGPAGPFRPYLLLSIKREAARQQRRRDRELALESDHLANVATLRAEGAGTGAPMGPAAPVEEMELDPELLLGRVFRSLNERFRNVLWLSEVEGHRPVDLAPLLGVSANAAAALCYRARRALRSGYFQAYAATLASPTCKPFIPQLAAYVEAGRSGPGHEQVRVHLAGCATCRDVARGAAQSGTVLAGLAPFGILSAGAWLDPARSHGAGPASDPDGTDTGGGRVVGVAAAVALLVALLAVALWPAPEVPDARRPAGVAAPRPSAGRTPPAPVPAVSSPTPTTRPPSAAPTTTTAPRPAVVPVVPSTLPDARPGDAAPRHPGGRIRGVLHLDRDGTGPGRVAASPGTPIRVVDRNGTVVARTATDAAGRFEVGPLAPSVLRVLATEPVGMVLTSDATGQPHGSTRREVLVGVVPVQAGTTSELAATFVPWRRLTIAGGSPTRSRVAVGEYITWTFDLEALGASAPGVTAELVIAHAVGTRVDVAWGMGSGVDGTAPGGGGAARSCELRRASRSTVARCALGTIPVGVHHLELSVEVLASGGGGRLGPTVTLSSGRGGVEAPTVSGASVSVAA